MNIYRITDNLPADHNITELAGELMVLDSDIRLIYSSEITLITKPLGTIETIPPTFTVYAPEGISKESVQNIISSHIPMESEQERGQRITREEFAAKIIDALSIEELKTAIKGL